MNLIVTADDFGRSSEINAAVVKAHKEGILTSASLMVAGDAFEEAVEIAWQTPTLAVGLHVVVVDGKPVLGPDQLTGLLDETGRFPNAPTRLGLRYFFDQRGRRQLANEVAAQFARFAETGLKLAHVDGHQHMHMHPAVFPLLGSLATRYGAGGIRLPRDLLRVALRYDHRNSLTKIVWAMEFALLSSYCHTHIRGLSVCDRVIGLMQTGKMETAYVVKMLEQLQASSAEIYFHPTTGSRTDELGPNPSDLLTLLSPAVRAVIEARKMRLCSYLDLPREK